MSKKKETTAVALISNFKMEDVPEMIQKLNEKINEITGTSEGNVKITEDLPSFGNIQNITDVPKLVQAYASVMTSEAMYENAMKELKLPSKFTYKIGSYVPDTWKKSIKTRIAEVTQEDLLKKLKDAKAELEKHLSGEDKLKAMFSNLTEIFEK